MDKGFEMIAERDRKKIIELCREYKVSRALLFGSGTSDAGVSRDIDLGVSGVPAGRFFAFYGELLFTLSKPVDLVDLDVKSAFTSIIQAEGLLLYG